MKTSRYSSLFLTGGVLALMLSLLAPWAAASIELTGPGDMPVPRLGEAGPGYVLDEVLVEFAQRASAQTSLTAVQEKADRIGTVLENRPEIATVKIASGRSVAETVRAYLADPRVVHAQPNYVYRAAATFPDDPAFGLLWGLHNDGQSVNGRTGIAGYDIGAPAAWDLQTDCSAIVVAVLDTGVNYRHADLAGNMWRDPVSGKVGGADFVGDSSDDDPMPYGGASHGTHVAGTIAAAGNNAQGMTGICWRAQIMSVRVLDDRGSGRTSDLIEGIAYAVNKGARLINMSLGADAFDRALHDTIASARDFGVLVVAAAGNDARDVDPDQSPVFPCSFELDNIICVAALNQNYDLAGFSNFGLLSVDVGAPGVSILSNYPGPRESFNLSSWHLDSAWAVDTGCANVALLVNPADWCRGGAYENRLEAGAFRTFDLRGSLGGGYRYHADVELNDAGDRFSSAHEAGASPGQPFDNGRIDRMASGPYDTGGFVFIEDGLEDCAGTHCSIGFQLATDHQGRGRGAAIGAGVLQKVVDGAGDIGYMHGTSMAAPHVSGVVALAWSIAPDKTFDEIRSAVLASGDPVMALAGITVTGRAVDAFEAIVAVNDPPSAQNASAQTPENTAVAVAISASDPNGHALGYTVAEAPADGTVTLSGNVATYTPDAGFSGTDTFSVRVDDGFTGTATASVSVSVEQLSTASASSNDGGNDAGGDSGGGGGGGAFGPAFLLLLSMSWLARIFHEKRRKLRRGSRCAFGHPASRKVLH